MGNTAAVLAAIRAVGAALCLCLFAIPGHAAGKVALIIGNSAYRNVASLPNPQNDAADLAAAFRRLGFAVTLDTDLGYDGMRLALRNFAARADGASVAVVYFAGHGIEIDNRNYLIPVDARLATDRDVAFEAIDLNDFVHAIESPTGLRIVIADACRNNPFLARIRRTGGPTRSIARGLGRVEVSGGVLVAYSARSGTEALDGQGRNSPYAAALLATLETPGLEIGRLFRLVRDRVVRATHGAQEPFTYGSLPGRDFYLAPPPEPVAEPAAAPGAARQSTGVPGLADAFAKADRAGTLAAWARFMADFGDRGDSPLVTLAAARLKSLQQAAATREARKTAEPWLVPRKAASGFGYDPTPEEWRQIQTALNYMGYDVGTPDGVPGPQTTKAVATARLDHGLRVGNIIDRPFLSLLPDIRLVDRLRSKKARSYKGVTLPEGLEPRLRRALSYFAGHDRRLRFGYFRGHLYIAEMDGYGSGFTQANAIAREIGGHLATITDSQEDRFVYELFSVDPLFIKTDGKSYFGPMFGLYQADTSHEPAGGWAWVTGEPLKYRHFNRGNPDNFGGRQDYARYYSGVGRTHPDHWDDTNPRWGDFAAFIFEID